MSSCDPKNQARQKKIGYHRHQQPWHQVRHISMQYETAKQVAQAKHGNHAETHPRIHQKRTIMIDLPKFL